MAPTVEDALSAETMPGRLLTERATVACQLLQGALLIDQTRTFTGSKAWLNPWLALPVIVLLTVPLVFGKPARSKAFSWSTWLILALAAVAVYWPLDRRAIATLALAAVAAVVVPWCLPLERWVAAFLPRLGRTPSSLRLMALVWGGYLWCQIVQPSQAVVILSVLALPLPAAWRLAQTFYPRSGPARWAGLMVLLLLIPSLPGSITGGRFLPIGFYWFLLTVLGADLLAVLIPRGQREHGRSVGVNETIWPRLSWSARGWLPAAAIVALGLAVRLAAFLSTTLPVGLDQFQYFAFADSIASTGITTAARPLYLLGAPLFYTGPLTGVFLAYVREMAGLPLFPGAAFLIVLVGTLQILAVMALVRHKASPLKLPLLAGLLWALAPPALDMQVWYGFGNAVSLGLLLLLLVAVRHFWQSGPTRADAFPILLYGTALGFVHPLTATVAVGVLPLFVAVLVCCDLRSGRRPWKKLLVLVVIGAVSLLIALPDIVVRYMAGGSGYVGEWQQYLADRPDAHYLGWTIGLLFVVFGAAGGALLLLRRLRGDAAAQQLAGACLALGAIVLLFSWLFGVRFPYGRTQIFIAAGLVPLAAVAAYRFYGHNMRAALIACAVLAAPHAGYLLGYSTEFFHYPNAQSIESLEWIAANTHPDDVLLVQQCQFSAAPYFAQRPTMVAIPSSQLASSTEFDVTQAADRIFAGSAGFQADVDKYDVKTVLFDKNCQVSGALRSSSQLDHLLALDPPFKPVFENTEALVLYRG